MKWGWALRYVINQRVINKLFYQGFWKAPFWKTRVRSLIITTRNLQINNWIINWFFVIITTCDLLQSLIISNKSYKILVIKDNKKHQVAMVVTWKCDLHEFSIYPNQHVWHHHFATNFMTTQCNLYLLKHLLFTYLNNIFKIFIFILLLISLNSTNIMLTCVIT
jgi:hypothetical protein